VKEKDQQIRAMGSELKLAGDHFDTSMVQLDRVQRDLFGALEKEKKKRKAAELEGTRLKMALAMIAHQQQRSTAFALAHAGLMSTHAEHASVSIQEVLQGGASLQLGGGGGFGSGAGGAGPGIQFLSH